MFSPLFTARPLNEQDKVSAGLRAVQNEQPNERQCSSSPPFRGVNTERAERTGSNIGRIRVRGPWAMVFDTLLCVVRPYLPYAKLWQQITNRYMNAQLMR